MRNHGGLFGAGSAAGGSVGLSRLRGLLRVSLLGRRRSREFLGGRGRRGFDRRGGGVVGDVWGGVLIVVWGRVGVGSLVGGVRFDQGR